MTAQAPAFTFEPTEVGRARLGRAHDRPRIIDTPQFMPVGTQATVKALTPGDLHAAGAQMILGNTYHLSLRPTAERIARPRRPPSVHGLGRTDPDRFRRLPGLLASPTCAGSTTTGSPSPPISTADRIGSRRARDEIQELLGSDMAMVFDQLVDPALPAHRGRRGHGPDAPAGRDARLDAHSRGARPLFGIVQGGIDAACAGSRSRADRRDAVRRDRRRRPLGGGVEGRDGRDPRRRRRGAGRRPTAAYLMGVGSPSTSSRRCSAGSTSSTASCRRGSPAPGSSGRDAGRLNLRNAGFQDDPGPIDRPAPARPAANHSRAYLAHLFRADELLAYRLASIHNVTYTRTLMARLRACLARRTSTAARIDSSAAHYERESVRLEAGELTSQA